MENDAIPVAPIDANTKPVRGLRWKRNLIELNGKAVRNYVQKDSPLLMKSYAELHTIRSGSAPASDITSRGLVAVSALEFDKEGTYLASVTRSGCLTVHEFQSLYNYCNDPVIDQEELDEKKELPHVSIFDGFTTDGISAVRWNPLDQDEIACTSFGSNELSIFDIDYLPSKPIKVLRTRPAVSIHERQGLSDIAFFNGDPRVLASDTRGSISMWDRRASDLPQATLTTNANIVLTSIQLLGDQRVYGASQSGFIYTWDLRGGRLSTAFHSDNEVHTPLTSVNLASMLYKSGPLKTHPNILPKEIQSIHINPSCPYQLGFYLRGGWSGVLDMHNFRVSHIHCPPLRTWLGGPDAALPRKPSWIPEHSIFAAASTSNSGIHLLDFYPHPSSPFHVDYDDSKSPQETVECKQSVFVPLSEPVTACATHPLSGSIVAGSMAASLLTISQKRTCKKGDEDDS